MPCPYKIRNETLRRFELFERFERLELFHFVLSPLDLDLIAINQIQKLDDDARRRAPYIPAVKIEMVNRLAVGRPTIGNCNALGFEQCSDGHEKNRRRLHGV